MNAFFLATCLLFWTCFFKERCRDSSPSGNVVTMPLSRYGIRSRWDGNVDDEGPKRKYIVPATARGMGCSGPARHDIISSELRVAAKELTYHSTQSRHYPWCIVVAMFPSSSTTCRLYTPIVVQASYLPCPSRGITRTDRDRCPLATSQTYVAHQWGLHDHCSLSGRRTITFQQCLAFSSIASGSAVFTNVMTYLPTRSSLILRSSS